MARDSDTTDEEDEKVTVVKGKATMRKKRRNKPKDYPKRPMSAYNVFFKETREEIIASFKKKDKNSGDAASNGDGAADAKVDFQTMAKEIAARWKNLAKEEKERVGKLAKKDMLRYRDEVKAYEEQMVKRNQEQREEAAMAAAASRSEDIKPGNKTKATATTPATTATNKTSKVSIDSEDLSQSGSHSHSSVNNTNNRMMKPGMVESMQSGIMGLPGAANGGQALDMARFGNVSSREELQILLQEGIRLRQQQEESAFFELQQREYLQRQLAAEELMAAELRELELRRLQQLGMLGHLSGGGISPEILLSLEAQQQQLLFRELSGLGAAGGFGGGNWGLMDHSLQAAAALGQAGLLGGGLPGGASQLAGLGALGGMAGGLSPGLLANSSMMPGDAGVLGLAELYASQGLLPHGYGRQALGKEE